MTQRFWKIPTKINFFGFVHLQEYLDTQRNRHLPPPLSLENTLMPTIISEQ